MNITETKDNTCRSLPLNLQSGTLRTWRMQERQNHLAPIGIILHQIHSEIRVTRKATYVYC